MTLSNKVIDLYHSDNIVDFSAMASETEFFIHKICQNKVDDKCKERFAKCEEVGLKYWGYVFMNKGKWKDQIDRMLSCVRDWDLLDKKHFVGLILDIEDHQTLSEAKLAYDYLLDYCQRKEIKMGIYYGHQDADKFLNLIKQANKDDVMTWCARYYTKQPAHYDLVDLWQFSDKELVKGLSKGCDCSRLTGRRDISWFISRRKETPVSNEKTTQSTSDIDKVIKLAESEVGYLEKRSKSKYIESIGRKDEKTYGAGSSNWTKYGDWIGCNGDYWCASFVSYIFGIALGKNHGKDVLGTFSAACESIRNSGKIKKTSTPKRGDIIFFKGSRHAGANHIGIVTKVTDGYVYTVEGNTSGGSTVVDNGGGVAKKCYAKGYSKILSYARPNYSVVVTGKTYEEANERSYLPKHLHDRGWWQLGDTSIEVLRIKKFLNWALGSKIPTTSNTYDVVTKDNVKKFQKLVDISSDGEWGRDTQRSAEEYRK